MTKNLAFEKSEPAKKDHANKRFSRRGFLNIAGASAGIVLIGSGCSKDDNPMSGGVNLGSGDTGILNYAYALEQLEAAFYIQVINSQYSGMTADERALFTDLRDHEIAHREFFKAALGQNAIPALEVNFSSVNFGSRDSVLATAKAFEDLGVAAYNGAGPLLTSADLLAIAGKIVSVEARHAAWVRDRISNGTFVGSDVMDLSTGLERSKTPAQVLTAAGPFIKTQINASNLPS